MRPRALLSIGGSFIFFTVTAALADRGTDLAKKAPALKGEVCGEVEDWRDCHDNYPTGCTDKQKARHDAYLNLLKNQLPDSALNPEKTLTKEDFAALDQKAREILATGNHRKHAMELAALGEGNLHAILGYLYYQFPTGAETCNCMLTSARDVDFHIGIGFDSDIGRRLLGGEEVDQHELEQNTIVVEMSPHYRGEIKRKWTTKRLDKVIGRQVRVVGQLMADTQHAAAKDVCVLATTTKEQQSCWRLSMWELHPITEIYVCNSDSPCSVDSPDWKKLEEF